MILEVATLDIKPGREAEFEEQFDRAQSVIRSMKGYVAHELYRCVERESRYLLLVRWETLEDHTVGFRDSPEYDRWRSLLHGFYDPLPRVEHYEIVSAGGSASAGN